MTDPVVVRNAGRGQPAMADEAKAAHTAFRDAVGDVEECQYNPKYAAPSGKHPGFTAVQSGIAKRMGVSKDRAGAILAASTRGASAAAKRKNPRLLRVRPTAK
jgi:hypothetical protein